jgi:ABC-type glutathione transport system ATPase component
MTRAQLAAAGAAAGADAGVNAAAADRTPAIEVRDLTMMYEQLLIMKDLSFSVTRGEVFVIMGGSGSGKSTLLKHLIGLKDPRRGRSCSRARTSARRTRRRGWGCSSGWASSTRTARCGAA